MPAVMEELAALEETYGIVEGSTEGQDEPQEVGLCSVQPAQRQVSSGSGKVVVFRDHFDAQALGASPVWLGRK